MSEWKTYNTTLRCIVDETEYDIPVWNMSVSSSPYSRALGDSVAIRAFDSRYYVRHQGWRTRARLSWEYLTSDAHDVLRDFLIAALEHGSFQAVFEPDLGTQVVEMVVEDAKEALVAVFESNSRVRPVSISFVSVNISSLAPEWITVPDNIPYQHFVFMGLSNNGSIGDTTSGIYALDSEFNIESFELVVATASRPRIIVPLNNRAQLLYQLDGDQSKIYLLELDTLSSSVWKDVSPNDVEGMAINERDEEVVVSIDDIDTGLEDKVYVYDYDGTFLRGSSNPPVTVQNGCMGIDSNNRHIYMKHRDSPRTISRFDLDTLVYDNAEASYVYGGMGPAEYNSVNNQLYYHENAAGNQRIYRKQPSGSVGGEVDLFTVPALTQMYYSKFHGELLVGHSVGFRVPPTGVEESGIEIITGKDTSPLCSGICVYEPSGGHTK